MSTDAEDEQLIAYGVPELTPHARIRAPADRRAPEIDRRRARM